MYHRSSKTFYTVNLATCKILSSNDFMDIKNCSNIEVSGEDIILKGSVEFEVPVRKRKNNFSITLTLANFGDDNGSNKKYEKKVSKFTFFNWAGRPFYFLGNKDRHSALRLYQTVGKLGYEAMSYDGKTQCNDFFSRKSKKLLLRTVHTNTYDQHGKVSGYKTVDLEEFIRIIKWYYKHNLRFEIIQFCPGFERKNYHFAVINTLQRYNVHVITFNTLLDKFPFLADIEFRHFIILQEKGMLLMINEMRQEILTISLEATSPSQLKYHKFDFEFRVLRDFSKDHGILVMFVKALSTNLVYNIEANGQLKPVFHTTNIKDCAFANRGHELICVKIIMDKREPFGEGSNERDFYFTGFKHYKIDLTIDLEELEPDNE